MNRPASSTWWLSPMVLSLLFWGIACQIHGSVYAGHNTPAGITMPVFSGRPLLNPIPVYYHQRPPYYDDRTVAENGHKEVRGLVATPIAKGLRGASIPFEWVKIPAKRQLPLLQSEEEPGCAAGWFKTRQREKIFLFSDEVYRDHPTIGVVRRNDTRLLEKRTIQELLVDPELVLLRKGGYSYGEFLDSWIARANPKTFTTVADNIGLLRMIARERADYTFMAKEEAEMLLAEHPDLGTRLRTVQVGGMPPGNSRHLVCNRQVRIDLLERFNRALRVIKEKQATR